MLVITSGASLTPARISRFPKETNFEMTLFSTGAALHDHIAGRAGAFDRTIEGVLTAVRYGCRVALTAVVNRLNASETGYVYRLGVALGANAFLFNRINFTRVTLPRAGQLAPTPEQLREALDATEEFATKYGVTVSAAVPIPPCVVDTTGYRRISFGWCGRGNEESYYTIGYNGLLRPCNHSSRILGDLKTQSFAEIVKSRKTRSFWAPVPPACRACTYPGGEACRGGSRLPATSVTERARAGTRWWTWPVLCHTQFLMQKLACLLSLVLIPLAAQPPANGSWKFAVSGDSRNCGDIVMPAIASGVLASRSESLAPGRFPCDLYLR